MIAVKKRAEFRQKINQRISEELMFKVEIVSSVSELSKSANVVSTLKPSEEKLVVGVSQRFVKR